MFLFSTHCCSRSRFCVFSFFSMPTHSVHMYHKWYYYRYSRRRSRPLIHSIYTQRKMCTFQIKLITHAAVTPENGKSKFNIVSNCFRFLLWSFSVPLLPQHSLKQYKICIAGARTPKILCTKVLRDVTFRHTHTHTPSQVKNWCFNEWRRRRTTIQKENQEDKKREKSNENCTN